MHSTQKRQHSHRLRIRIRSFMLIMLAPILVIGAFAQPAQAETITAEAKASSMDEATVAATIKSAVVVNTNAEGKIVGAWVKNPGPTGHWNPAKAKQVRYASSYNAGVKTCRPFRLKKGEWMPRTLKRRDGVVFQVQGGTTVKYPWSLFDQGKTCSNVRHRGYYNSVQRQWKGDCVNPKPTPDMPSYPPSMVVEVEQHTMIDYQLELDWTASAWVYGSVTVTCPKSSATSSFKSMGSTTGSTSLRISARTRAEAETEGGRQVSLSLKSNTSVRASIMGSGEVSAEGEAKASCTSDEEEPTPPKAVVSVDQLNDIDETDPNCEGTPAQCESWTVFQGHVTVPDGVSGILRVSSSFGSTKFTKGTASTSDDVTSLTLGSGQHDPEIRYVAPTEVPAGGYDTITLTFTPAGGGEPVQATTRIKINETPTPPQ